jgi:hypothetical protein
LLKGNDMTGTMQKIKGKIDTTFIYLQRDKSKDGLVAAGFSGLFAYFTLAGASITESMGDSGTKVFFTGFTVAMAGISAFYGGHAVYDLRKSWKAMKTPYVSLKDAIAKVEDERAATHGEGPR